MPPVRSETIPEVKMRSPTLVAAGAPAGSGVVDLSVNLPLSDIKNRQETGTFGLADQILSDMLTGNVKPG